MERKDTEGDEEEEEEEENFIQARRWYRQQGRKRKIYKTLEKEKVKVEVKTMLEWYEWEEKEEEEEEEEEDEEVDEEEEII